MNSNPRVSCACATPGEVLVEYVDGALPAAEAAGIERHLAECDACRREIVALERSLALAQSIWATAADSVSPVREASPRIVRPWRVAAALGAVAAVVMVAVLIFLAARSAEDRNFASAASDRTETRGTERVSDEIALDDMDIEAFIQRQEQSARLAASVRLLATLPVDREDAKRAERYLREAYGIE